MRHSKGGEEKYFPEILSVGDEAVMTCVVMQLPRMPDLEYLFRDSDGLTPRIRWSF